MGQNKILYPARFWRRDG